MHMSAAGHESNADVVLGGSVATAVTVVPPSVVLSTWKVLSDSRLRK
jgi:hypothetical protein